MHNEHACVFREKMEHGYFTFSSVKDPQKYLGFMRNGRPINYSHPKHDEKCRQLYKREVHRDSSNDVASTSKNSVTSYQEMIMATTTAMSTTTASPMRKSSSSRMQQKTHSNRIDSSKTSRNTSRAKTHHVRHHHNEFPLRHSHNNSNSNLINAANRDKDRINEVINNGTRYEHLLS